MLLHNYSTILWDFDGVIKEYLYVKTGAFFELFYKYGTDVTQKVREHHEVNGCVSSFEKIPYYFEKFVGMKPS